MIYYQKLVSHFQTINNFSHLSAICGWDQAAMMPSGGNQARSEAMTELSIHIHRLSTQSELGDWIAEAENESLSNTERASLREIKRSWQQATALPEDLLKAQSLAGSKCEHAWRTQRGENDWQGFRKNFAEVVNLSQQEAKIRAERLSTNTATSINTTPYDAMLDLYEPGTSTEFLNKLFSHVKTWLPELTQQVQQKQASENYQTPTGHFSISAQKALGKEVMTLLGFDFNHGRLDVSTHPFCGGVPSDVRMTTRYDESDFVSALMGTVHETGHARYEQGLPKSLAGLPAGNARSMGIHESQSLFFEMQLGRSSQFIEHLAPMAAKVFEQKDNAAFQVDNIKTLYTRVNPSLIRVDADEITYPAHVILRYEIERDLINGEIRYQDIPELWDQKMQESLGLSTKDNYKDGCMQDIHWTDGAFGYFPSYTLGAMYAAQFMATLKQKVDVDACVQSGDLSPIFNWLAENIWSKASTLSTDDLVTAATGEVLNAEHFKRHLEQRYL